MPWLETDFRQRYNHAVPTDRVSAEVPLSGELIRQEALLDKLFATVPEAIVVLDTDDSILRVNPEFTRIFGYAEEEALGRPINELVVPEELWAEAVEYTRRGTRGEILNVETMRKRKDGARVPVSIVGVPVSIAGSQISEYVIYRDITERKHAEQRLRQSEAYLAEAQRLSQTGSWAWNPATGENTYGSEECLRVLGFDPAGPIPRFEEFFQRIHPDDQAASGERFEKAIRDKADFEFEYRIVHPDRGVRDIHVVGHAVLDRSGDLGEFIGTVIDVTERKQAEQELQQLVDFVPQLIVVLDCGGKRIHTNRVFREYTGLTPEELRSGDAVASLIHPDDLERMRAARDRGIAAGEPFELDARLLGKDGIYRWFLARYNPLVEEGRARRWYLTATEIESRKQEEERIRQENVRLEERTRIAQELHDTLLQTFQSASCT
jgi:PAS domain S-box-containing protein